MPKRKRRVAFPQSPVPALKFKRQVPVDRFVADFFCVDAKLIVEIDGGQHERRRQIGSEQKYWNRWGISCSDFGTIYDVLAT